MKALGQFNFLDALAGTPANAVRAPAPPVTPPRVIPPAAPSLVDIRGERLADWERFVATDNFKPKPQIIVARHWTGIVVEDLSHPRLGRKFLHADGTIQDVARDSAHYLTIFMTADEARALHIRWPLVHFGTPGTSAARFRLAEPGEDAPLTLKLPEGM